VLLSHEACMAARVRRLLKTPNRTQGRDLSEQPLLGGMKGCACSLRSGEQRRLN